MSYQLQTTPQAGAKPNPLGITFGATAQLEFAQTPEKLINKDVSEIELVMVDTVGVYLHKGPLSALIPWAAIITMQY